MRCLLAFSVLLLCCLPSLAADEAVVHDCKYWRLGKDKAEKTKLLKACDQIIGDKAFSKADRAMAYAERAGFAANDKRSDDAIADYGQALALAPLAPDATRIIGWRRTRADLLHFKGAHDRAIEDYDKVLEAHANGHVTFYRGLSYLGKGDETRGFADLSKGIELDPEDPWLRYQRGYEYAKRGQLDAALADEDNAIALKGDDRSSYLLRAELHTKKGDTEKAIADLTRAAELDPEYALSPISNRVLLYEQTKQYDLAIADYDKLLSLSPSDAYYTERKAALLDKLAREPKPIILRPGPSLPQPTAPLEVESKPVEPTPSPKQEPSVTHKPKVAGQGECRRFDPIANLTISVACPE